jgi:L-alanine-DL-glutamate epimerase-like enolase superfamily enzyme
VKVGLDVETDVERVALVRELAGPATFIGTDANTGWSAAEARLAIAGFAPYGVAFVEQPVAAKALDDMAALRAFGLPIVADESVGDMADLVAVLRASAADVVSVYVGMSGGPGRAVDIGRVAGAFGVPCVIGSNGEMGIGAAAQLHVACAIPSLSPTIPSDVIGAHFYTEDILADPLDSDGVTVRLPNSPGLGVVPRPDLVSRFE